LHYGKDPPTSVDLNNLELEAFDPHANYSLSPTPAEDAEAAPTALLRLLSFEPCFYNSYVSVL
jgi:hypothetical protein